MSNFLSGSTAGEAKIVNPGAKQDYTLSEFERPGTERGFFEKVFRNEILVPGEFVTWMMDQFSLRGFEVPLSQVHGFASTSAQIIIEKQELAASGTFDFQNIPDRYSHLRLIVYSRSDASVTSDFIRMRYNADSGNRYYSQSILGQAATASAAETLAQAQTRIGLNPGANATANLYGIAEITIPFYKNTTNKKSHTSQYFDPNGTTTGLMVSGVHGGYYDQVDAINRIQIAPETTPFTFAAGSIATLYAHN